MDSRVVEILRRQFASGLPDLAGAHAAAMIPLPDQFLNELIAASIPPSAAVSAATVEAHAPDRLTLHVRLARPAFIPSITLHLRIESQPALPTSPVLVLRFETAGMLMNVAGPALNSMKVLPPGVHVDGERIHVNIKTILDERGLGHLLRFVENLEITAADGAVLLTAKARV